MPYRLPWAPSSAAGWFATRAGPLRARVDRRHPRRGATVVQAAGCAVAALAPTIAVYTRAQGLVIGVLGASAGFAPLVADASR